MQKLNSNSFIIWSKIESFFECSYDIFIMQISCAGNLVTQAGFQMDAFGLRFDWLSNKHRFEKHA